MLVHKLNKALPPITPRRTPADGRRWTGSKGGLRRRDSNHIPQSSICSCFFRELAWGYRSKTSQRYPQMYPQDGMAAGGRWWTDVIAYGATATAAMRRGASISRSFAIVSGRSFGLTMCARGCAALKCGARNVIVITLWQGASSTEAMMRILEVSHLAR